MATVASLSPLPQQLVGHALAARQAILVSSAATVVSLSLQQLLQLALSAATSPLTAICLSSALSAAQRSNNIIRSASDQFRGCLFGGSLFCYLQGMSLILSKSVEKTPADVV